MNNNQFDIAISYSRDSETFVKKLVDALSHKYKVFFDINQYKMLVCKFLHEILYDIFYNLSDFAILVITKDYLTKSHPMWEARTIIAKSVFVPNKFFIILSDELNLSDVKMQLCINDNYKFCLMSEVENNMDLLIEIIESRISNEKL